MAIQLIGGLGQQIWYPHIPAIGPTFTNSTAIAATGEKFAMSGRIWYPNPTSNATRAIRRVGFRFGTTTTKAGGSALTLSLQDTSLTAAPMQPDETQDQTVAIANAAIAANTWLRTGTLSADRTVAFGDYLSVVIEYDGSGRLGSDTINFSGLASATTTSAIAQCVGASKVSGTWTANTQYPNLALEFSDGSFGTLMGAIPISAINAHTFKQDTGTADEFALAFQMPYSCYVDGLICPIFMAATTTDFSFVLYDGTTAMTGGTVTVDASATVPAGGVAHHGIWPFTAEIPLTINHQYYLAVKPTQTTSAISINSIDVADANQLVCHPGGVNFNYATRLDLGAWAAITTTRRLFAGLHLSRLDDGAGSGAGPRFGLAGAGPSLRSAV